MNTVKASSSKKFVFKKVSLGEVESRLRETGKYREGFVKGLVKGLSKSSFYANPKIKPVLSKQHTD